MAGHWSGYLRPGLLFFTRFFRKRRTEVVKAMTLDYTFERQLMLEREEARTEEHQEGLQEGLREGLQKGLERGHEEGYREGMEEGERKSLIVICRELGVSYDETAAKVKERFSLGDEEVRKSMRLYW